ncbi:translocation/assembly module TamB domain-containing protein [Paracoccus pacificus]|uniref:Translocation/assembly module TamB domain-containing protein n=1 Tax=Paracoccus pacificus TaxID=1463598 RepID=A0ABW4R6V8_9RHOB
MRRFILLLLLVLLPVSVMAQDSQTEEDKGFLTRFLEEKLSGAGRQVVISGFAGALSSRATFASITIADDQGVWLTLRNGAIQWNRSAILRGRIEIAELSAAEIDLPRTPTPAAQASVATPEAREFSLPELPVSVKIEKLLAERVVLGQPIIGLPAELRVSGDMSLEGGEGTAVLNIDRLDGPRGRFALNAAFSNTTRNLNLNLDLDEDKDGLAVNLLNIPDRPAIKLQVAGRGPISNYAADIVLATDGQPRVTGKATLATAAGPDDSPGQKFRLALDGDISPLLPVQHRAFFGNKAVLLAEGWRGESGRIALPVLMIDTNALNLSGSLNLGDDGAPQSAVMLMTVGTEAGATEPETLLPFGNAATRVSTGRFELVYDKAKGDGWTLNSRMRNLKQAMMTIDAVDLNGSGSVKQEAGRVDEVTGVLNFDTTGIAPTDKGLALAIGETLKGRTDIHWARENPLELTNLSLEGGGYGLTGDIRADGLGSGITVSGEVEARHDDLSRLSTLAGRALKGNATATISGLYTVLTKGFDVEAKVTGNDIAINQPQVDRMLAGESAIELSARRDETGIELRDLTVNAQNLTAQAQGMLTSNNSDLTATASMPDLSVADPAFGGALKVNAKITGPAGLRRLAVDGIADDLVTGIAELDGALKGQTVLTVAAQQQENGGLAVETLRLANTQLIAEGNGTYAKGTGGNANITFSMPDLTVMGRGFAGAIKANARLSEANGTRSVDIAGTGTNLSFGQAQVDGAMMGDTRLMVRASEKDGTISIEEARLTNDQMNATAQGTIGKEGTNASAHAVIRNLAAFGAGWRGTVTADATFADDGTGARKLTVDGTGQNISLGQRDLDAALSGETKLTVRATERQGVFDIEQADIQGPNLTASAKGVYGGGKTDINATARASSLAFLGRGLSGALNADARLVEQNGERQITASGNASNLAIGNEKADALLRGQTTFDVAATQKGGLISVQRLNLRNPQLSVQGDGALNDGVPSVKLTAMLGDLALLVPGFPGPVQINGTARQDGSNYVMDLNGTAPGGTRLQVAGSIASNFQNADLRIEGVSDAAIANPFLRTRSLEGAVNFNLLMQGKPGLDALSGRISIPSGRLADPKLGIRIDNLALNADLGGGRINVDARGNVNAGGSLRVSGPIELRGDRNMDIVVMLNDVRIRDPNLYQTRANGEIRIQGPQALGATISGTINLFDTEIRVPATSGGGAGDIPEIRHINDSAAVRATRAKAGLAPWPSRASAEAGMTGPAATPPTHPMKLDLLISAPTQVFVRGRGLDAELGGQIRLTGTTQNIIPIGTIELIRGRLDLLGKRFDLDTGIIEMQGSLMPVVQFIASNQQDGITTRIEIEGDITDPEIHFTSDPDMPEEEVLSQLLFGRGLDKISALQAAQLANAIAVLAGRGGAGIVDKLRSSFGLDDLDLSTDDQGRVSVRAGKYISKNVYTDVAVGQDGKSTVNLNLDISPSLTARGSVDNEGDSSLGLFYERDY